MARSELVDLNVFIRHETAMAVLIDHPDSNSEKVWLPLSRVEFEDADHRPGWLTTITLPRYLAEEKGLC